MIWFLQWLIRWLWKNTDRLEPSKIHKKFLFHSSDCSSIKPELVFTYLGPSREYFKNWSTAKRTFWFSKNLFGIALNPSLSWFLDNEVYFLQTSQSYIRILHETLSVIGRSWGSFLIILGSRFCQVAKRTYLSIFQILRRNRVHVLVYDSCMRIYAQIFI